MLSCPTEQEGVRLLSQLRQLLAIGSFRITKIISNRKLILSNCPAQDLMAGVDLSCGELSLHKDLGVYWETSDSKSTLLQLFARYPSLVTLQRADA